MNVKLCMLLWLCLGYVSLMQTCSSALFSEVWVEHCTQFVISSKSASQCNTAAVHSAADGGNVGIEIKTVDGYQGREKDIIIFSAVRANADEQVSYCW